jgi:hypothetical protein
VKYLGIASTAGQAELAQAAAKRARYGRPGVSESAHE